MFSFSLEGLTGGDGVGNKPSSSLEVSSANTKELRHPFSGEERGDSLVSLSEEDLESGQREHRMFGQQVRLTRGHGANLENPHFLSLNTFSCYCEASSCDTYSLHNPLSLAQNKFLALNTN